MENTHQYKIVYVLPYSEEESGFIFSKRQILDMEKMGHITETFFLKNRLSITGLYKEYKRLKLMVLTTKPDIIHAQYGTITAFIASRIAHVPLVITFQGSDLNKSEDIGMLQEKVGKILSYIAARRARKIICVSKMLFKNLKIGKSKATIIPNGIDISVFKPLSKDKCREELKLGQKKYVFFNGSNPIIKRLDIAQAVIQKLADFDAELLLLAGNVDPVKIPQYLNASDVLLLCSDTEGSPMVIKEAMACNLPIVSVSVGDVVERLKGVENCFVVEQNIDELVDKIQFIFNHNIIESTGRKELINQEMDSESVCNAISKVYDSLMV